METYSGGTTPAEAITRALAGERYKIRCCATDEDSLTFAVNQGIDSHLEAVTDSKFTRDGYGRLCGDISPEGMLVIIRRLGESDDEEHQDFRQSILQSIGIEEV